MYQEERGAVTPSTRMTDDEQREPVEAAETREEIDDRERVRRREARAPRRRFLFVRMVRATGEIFPSWFDVRTGDTRRGTGVSTAGKRRHTGVPDLWFFTTTIGNEHGPFP